jgi:nucleoid-associated protein YgaU
MLSTLQPRHAEIRYAEPTLAMRAPRRVYLRRRLMACATAVVLVVVVIGGLAGVANRADADQPGADGSGLTENGTTRYVVRSGDTLWSIAARVSPERDPRGVVDAIARANAGLVAGSLQAGQLLLIPPSA